MSSSSSTQEAILKAYAQDVESYFQSGVAREHTYRSSLQNMLEKLGSGIQAVNEPRRVECGAPDYVVLRKLQNSDLTIGYIEAKDIGVSLDKIEKDEQLKRYLRALDNLLLTDYLEFRWYVKGEKQETARLATPKGKNIVPNTAEIEKVLHLLNGFLQRSAEPIRRPEELAKRMARLAHMIRDVIIEAFEKRQESDTLKGLYEAFKSVLLPDLTTTAFADMFAQTLAYGLFAARYNHRGSEPFQRRDAANEIPRTNPFLRKLFSTIAASEFEDEPYIGFVNELAQVLAVTDMTAVLADFGKRTRREDPIVHFYETFLVQYDPKLRELRGVYYTPEPVVSYIVRSVDALLKSEFGCAEGLADTSTVEMPDPEHPGKMKPYQKVLLLDPACGTGTFLYAIIDHIRETYRQMGMAGMWSGYVKDFLLPRLFGFELLMAPYAVAHLKLGMQLAALDLPEDERADWAYDFDSKERLGLYLTNTLEQALGRSRLLMGAFISDEANEAAKVKRDAPVMVVIGNPPYSGHSANKGTWITELLRGLDSKDGQGKGKTSSYFEVDGQPLGERNPKWLNDDYVKFIRFAQWRIEQTGYGILAFITNHGYLDNPTFRGMRQSLMSSFDDIYVLDLHGNSRKKEQAPDGSKDENVFDIQQGVVIGFFVRRKGQKKAGELAKVHHAHLWGERDKYVTAGETRKLTGGKYHWLNEHDITSTHWTDLAPHSPFYLFTPQDVDIREEYQKAWAMTEIMKVNVLGFQTHRDHFAIDFDKKGIEERISEMADTSITDNELKEKRLLVESSNWQVADVRRKIQSEINWQKYVIRCLYRPFDLRYCFFSDIVVDRPRIELKQHMLFANLALNITRQTKANEWKHAIVSNTPTPALYVEIKDGSNAFPLYLYPDPKKKGALFEADEQPTSAPSGRRPNLAAGFIADAEQKLGLTFVADGKGDLQQTVGPEDIFAYMYAVFHSPTYRTRYAEFLKIDFPRLPLTSNGELFRQLCGLGERLVGLHLMEKFGTLTPKYPVKGNDVVEKIEYRVSEEAPEKGRVYINKEQYFDGVPAEVWEFHVGGYQVCQKWLKDRKGRRLTFEDIRHYMRIVGALAETITLMERIDETIDEHGGWPLG